MQSDLAKVDAHAITPEEYDEIPELTDAMLARADFHVGDRFVRRGPPDLIPGLADEPVMVRLLPEVVAHFRAMGPGWQARVNAVLMAAVERERGETPR
ncbi:BrnA antitoxin family protein [Methylobacterium sp. J-026]|uniref:BrnA antitoxin family protein n=1 Tax=Methylobacterium sp. J-026 TaxID=2836624 RepID=UPI001FB9A6CF|nr:BrnA antitoxin family protein [Methylobacterium sp. J-026]MCJ2134781.1 BrnA antitoxin family protein [Methylobacterium sp. J-026]